jgi:hypothetical protein
MAKQTRYKKQLIFHPLLVTAAPALSLYAINAEQILLREALDLLLVVRFTSTILWLSVGFLSKRFDKTACFISNQLRQPIGKIFRTTQRPVIIIIRDDHGPSSMLD